MNKLDYENELEKLIDRYETKELIPFVERIERLKQVIITARKYNSKYKNPHKHYFMGKPIKYSDILLDELERLVIQAETLNLNLK